MRRSLFWGVVFICCYGSAGWDACYAASAAEERWIEETRAGMSIEEKIGELIDLPLDSRKMADEAYIQERIKEIREYHVGSYMFLMYPGDMHEMAKGIERMKEASRVPLIVGTNSEGGAGGFIRQAVRFPTQMSMGASRDWALTYQAGRIMALECKAIGVDMGCIPNGSLNNNPGNPEINIRAFGDDPQLAAELGVAYIKGLQDFGFPAQITLFPGLGDKDVDSHQTLPTLNVRTRQRFFTTELVPYLAAFDAGCAAIMTGHVIIPCMDPEFPATLSKIIMTDLLRDALKFDGLVFTDAIRMNAIMNHFGVGESAVLAMEAGCDVIVWPRELKPVYGAMLEAVRSGRITEKRIDESLRRRLRFKVFAGVHKGQPLPLQDLERRVGIDEYRKIAQMLADKAITVAKDDGDLVPLENGSQTAFLMLNGNNAYGKEIRDNFPQCPVLNLVSGEHTEALEIDPDPARLSPDIQRPRVTTEEAKQEIMSRLAEKSVVVVAAFLGRDLFRRSGPTEGYFKALQYLIDSGKKVCLIAFGDPYIYRSIPGVQTYICAYGLHEFDREAVWRVLKGQIPAVGKLPVKVEGLQ